MKRVLSLLFLTGSLLLYGCEWYDLQLDRNYVEVDHRAQEFVINADAGITQLGFFINEYGDLQLSDYKEVVSIMRCRFECGWIRLDIDYSDPNHFSVSLDENTSSKTRKAKVDVGRLVGGDTLLVVQKGRPKPRMTVTQP